MKKVKISSVLICALVVALVLALYYGLFFGSLTTQTNAMNQKHTEYTQQLNYYHDEILKKADVQKNITSLQEQVKTSGKKMGVPPAQLNDDLISAFSASGITTKSVTSQDEVNTKKKTSSGRLLKTVSLTVTASCKESQLASFLHYLEKGTTAVYYVTGITVAPENTTGSTFNGVYTVTVKMDAYYFVASNAPAKVKAVS